MNKPVVLGFVFALLSSSSFLAAAQDNIIRVGFNPGPYKEQFEKVDMENYDVDLSDDRIVFKSKESRTITVTSMVEKDEKYDESSTDF